MGNILRSPITANAIFLTPRSGSHSLVVAAIAQWWPGTIIGDAQQHPACWIPWQENWTGDNENVGIIVRNPVERFRSMAAHKQLAVDAQLADPLYGPLPQNNFARYFKFERDLDAVCAWLGLPTPLPQEDATNEMSKPVLTPEQEARVRELYAADVALWETL